MKKEIEVRPYTTKDMGQLIEVYQSAFREPPWNEEWGREEIIQDLEFALGQQNTIMLVADVKGDMLGFTWGYELPLEKFPFLQGIVESASYMDEIAVRGDCRVRGIGTSLGLAYIDAAREQGFSEVTLRTDDRNIASMTLFGKLGFKPITNGNDVVYDPKLGNRIYMRTGGN